MDYEKLHKDTINNLQQMVSCGKITVETARSICVDFVYESEDERMWKLVKKYANYIPNTVLDSDHITRKQLVTWFEKQSKSQKGLFALEAERYFSESEENKDEKWIPKEIVKYIKEKGCFRSCWITWLEKQLIDNYREQP